MLTLILSFTPLIVRLRVIEFEEPISNFAVESISFDIFSFYKMAWLVFMGSILLLSFLIYIYKDDLTRTYYYMPLSIYAVFAILSSVFSEYPDAVLMGFPERYENIFVLLVYVILTAVTINIVQSRDFTRFVLGGLIISAIVLGIHGIFQFVGFELLSTELGRRLIVPQDLRMFANMIDFRYGAGRIFSTLYNPNYVGSFGAMLVSLFLGFYFTSTHRKKLFFAALSILMFAYLVGSHSRAGMVGFMAGLIFLGFLLRKTLRNKWRSAAAIMLCFLAVLMVMDVFSVDDIPSELISPTTEPDLVEEEMEEPELLDINSAENRLSIDTEAVELNLTVENGGTLDFWDEDGNRLDTDIEEHEEADVLDIYFTEEEYSAHSFQLDPAQADILWRYDNMEALFSIEESDFLIMGMNNNFYEIQEVPSWGFDGYEGLGSSRGYIWSRSLPLLQDTLLLGNGPGTFAMYYPQEDVVGKLKHLGFAKDVVDKPHNMFLQKAINTGLPSLLALIVLWGGYLLQGLKLYNNADISDWRVKTGISLVAAVAAYLVTGFFNDSVVSVAPVFWVLLGIGISMNIQYRKSRE